MSKTLFTNDAIGKLKSGDDLGRAAEKLKRDPRLDEAFLLHPENYRILQGKGMQPFNYNWLMLVFSLLCLVLLLFMVEFAIRFGLLTAVETPTAIAATAIVSLMGLGILLFIALSVKSIRDDRDFDQNSVLLVGSLSSIGGEWRRSSGKNRSSQYRITAAYNVELPDGKIITETAWANRRDLEDFNARPKRGTPVAVQYSTTSKKIRLL